MNRKILVCILFLSFLPGQVEFKHECGHAQSAYRWLDATSTMTEDQGKLDISYYGINLEIDFSSEMIYGSVVINGSVGMIQPDSFEFDFLSNMIVDSIKYFGAGNFIFASRG